MLDLKHPIYKQTAAYGHFGRTDVLLPWEKLDKVNVLKDAVRLINALNNIKEIVEIIDSFHYN